MASTVREDDHLVLGGHETISQSIHHHHQRHRRARPVARCWRAIVILVEKCWSAATSFVRCRPCPMCSVVRNLHSA